MVTHVTPPALSFPPGLEWRHDTFFGHHWLFMDHVVVGQVTPVESLGRWVIYVHRQWPITRSNPSAPAPTLTFGKRMVERWLAANYERVRAEVELHPKPHKMECVMGDRSARPPPVEFDEKNFHVPKRKTRRRR
jgi:hypothetical protein